MLVISTVSAQLCKVCLVNTDFMYLTHCNETKKSRIQNVSDVRCLIEVDIYLCFSVYENRPIGAEVGQVLATDDDLPPNSKFSFYLDASYTPVDMFKIDPESGIIRTKLVGLAFHIL